MIHVQLFCDNLFSFLLVKNNRERIKHNIGMSESVSCSKIVTK